mmetsp:Transcript_1904/g.7243  ORF Transcript_1904/g.7243 Transcript_1904/m.7243 type:complete len:192 (-) Transcript_1904:4976-5551(-)
MSAVAASSLAFTAAVVPRAVRARTSTVVRAAGRARVTVTSAVDKVAPKDVKDHLDRGFVLVDIRDPEECAETGYKFSWKNIVLAAMDDSGQIHMNPNFLAQIRKEFPNQMSRILIACDDGTMRSEKAAGAIVDKCGFKQVKIIEGGIDAYLVHSPLTEADKVKWRMRPEIGEDLSVLVSGVDTRQQGQKYY